MVRASDVGTHLFGMVPRASIKGNPWARTDQATAETILNKKDVPNPNLGRISSRLQNHFWEYLSLMNGLGKVAAPPGGAAGAAEAFGEWRD